jgi:hypothetical protein
MSVLLEYETLQPVTEEVANQIDNDWHFLLASRSYWVEPLWVKPDASPPSKLIGCHKMFMSGGYSNGKGQWVDVSEDEDWLMAWSDADFAVKQLAQWSAKHGMDWVILSYGEAIGRIVEGTPDNDLCEFVASMREMTRLDPEMVAEIDKKYQSRAEPTVLPEADRAPSMHPISQVNFTATRKRKSTWWWPW